LPISNTSGIYKNIKKIQGIHSLKFINIKN
jgi:hypothetical protein